MKETIEQKERRENEMLKPHQGASELREFRDFESGDSSTSYEEFQRFNTGEHSGVFDGTIDVSKKVVKDDFKDLIIEYAPEYGWNIPTEQLEGLAAEMTESFYGLNSIKDQDTREMKRIMVEVMGSHSYGTRKIHRKVKY